MKSRETPAKRIKRTKAIREKLRVALGWNELAHYCPPETIHDCKQIIRSCVSPGSWLEDGLPVAKPDARKIKEMAGLGYAFLLLISDRDYKFFSRLAGVLQYDREAEEPHKLYLHILMFCVRNGECGSKQKPCDRRDLLANLRKLGHRGLEDDRGKSSRRLRDACQLIGIVLTRG